MTPAEIAETLLNGNIAAARAEILGGGDKGLSMHHARVDSYRGAALALDVVQELAKWMSYRTAVAKVRRCLEGAS